jgi:hypothetical protein
VNHVTLKPVLYTMTHSTPKGVCVCVCVFNVFNVFIAFIAFNVLNVFSVC